MPLSYRPLFLLEANTAFIFEIKRLDVQSENPADVYFWLYFDKASQVLHQLTFVSMSADGDEQQREFTQGQLRFSANAGTYTPTGSGMALALRPVVPPMLPAEMETAMFMLFNRTETSV